MLCSSGHGGVFYFEQDAGHPYLQMLGHNPEPITPQVCAHFVIEPSAFVVEHVSRWKDRCSVRFNYGSKYFCLTQSRQQPNSQMATLSKKVLAYRHLRLPIESRYGEKCSGIDGYGPHTVVMPRSTRAQIPEAIAFDLLVQSAHGNAEIRGRLRCVAVVPLQGRKYRP